MELESILTELRPFKLSLVQILLTCWKHNGGIWFFNADKMNSDRLGPFELSQFE